MKRRDLTTTQYLAALHRNGFRLVKGFFAGYVETDEVPGTSYGPIVSLKDFRILRRESLARFIQTRNRDVAKQQAARKAD